MNKPQIFISHISEESAFANSLKEWIDDTLLGGVSLFVSSDDGESIPLGSEWLEKIKRSLELSSIILVLISHKSKNKKWIYFESGAGYVRGIPVIPICIGGIKKIELPTPLNLLQAIELPDTSDEKKLIEIIARSAGLKTPKVFVHKLEFPKEKIIENTNNIKSNPVNEMFFLENINLSKIKSDLIFFFLKEIEKNKNDEFTITEIEKNANLKQLKKRKYILKTLEEFLELNYITKFKNNKNTYWQLTNEGIKMLNKIKKKYSLH